MPQPIEFVGVPSGDCECFCFDVDAETYRRVNGHDPQPGDEAIDHATMRPIPGMYRLYANDLIPDELDGKPVRVRISVEPA